MAIRQKADRALDSRLDEWERMMFLLKVAYEKYFGGTDPIEPMREREAMVRFVRDLSLLAITNTQQAHRFRTLKARWSSLDLWITRNLVQIERGTHPRFKFRADMRERARTQVAEGGGVAPAPSAPAAEDREEAVLRQVYDRYIEARKTCGQSVDLDYESMKKTLRQQVRQIKAQFKCTSVKFRVTVEDGKARLKAVPQR